MSVTENQNNTTLGISAELVVWLQNVFSLFAPKRTSCRLQQRMEEDLKRLAETSPHLLDDIGFIEDELCKCSCTDDFALGVGNRSCFALIELIEMTVPSNGSFVRRSQLVDATHALKCSAGVSYPRAIRGRS